jgi:hypothetical protein
VPSRRLQVASVVAVVAAVGVATIAVTGSGATTFPTRKNPIFAQMTGGQEVNPTTGRNGAGDNDGRGGFSALISRSAGMFCYGVAVRGIDSPILMHIHKAPRGVNGPIVIPLTPPATGDPGSASACVAVSDQKLLKNIQLHPDQYYANIHTTAFPGGAIRGQLQLGLTP